MTDQELTQIYNDANGLNPKPHNPISTERIFAAMRAVAAKVPTFNITGDRLRASELMELLEVYWRNNGKKN